MNQYQSSSSCVYQGDICYRAGNYSNALCWYKEGLKKDRNNFFVLAKKGNVLYKLHKRDDAYWCFLNALIYAGVVDIVDGYIDRYSLDLKKEIGRLNSLLTYKYNIPIIQDGLLLVLKNRKLERDETKWVKEWKRFKKQLQGKKLCSPEGYVDLFLRRFGDLFYRHFYRLHCFLYQDMGFSLSIDSLVDIIVERRKMLELESFERMLQTGRGKRSSLDRMSGSDFEEYLCVLFEKQGYQVSRTPVSHDHGADLLVSRFGERCVVQAKRRKRSVGVSAVQEVFAAKSFFNTDKAVVVTTGVFTRDAVVMADRLGVELWDRKRLRSELEKPRM